jgi:hypothetical protein
MKNNISEFEILSSRFKNPEHFNGGLDCFGETVSVGLPNVSFNPNKMRSTRRDGPYCGAGSGDIKYRKKEWNKTKAEANGEMVWGGIDYNVCNP